MDILPLPGTEHVRYQSPSGLWWCEIHNKYIVPNYIIDAKEPDKSKAACFDCIIEEQGMKDLEFAEQIPLEGEIVSKRKIIFDGEYIWPCAVAGCKKDWEEECAECEQLFCKSCMRGAICKDCLKSTTAQVRRASPRLLLTKGEMA